jgi:nitrogen fixation/metabolism regulation signal transduction histidine kinase
VLVFDDITQLLQAQRDAAWGEVARRLAHEIKNPLTPIQLSAER